jgi:hypothetical protein
MEKTEKINSIEQLRMQKELLQLQQKIAELRMKKEFHELKDRMSVRNLILPSLSGIMKAGLGTNIGKQLLFSTATKFTRKIFKKGKRKNRSIL